MTVETRWEEGVYSKGKQLNRYPYDAVVSFVFSRLAGTPDRSAIRILDLGCGAGNNAWFLVREGFTVAGIDGSESAVDFARTRLADEGHDADLRVGDLTELPWPDGSFDVAIDRVSITHNTRPDIERALDEVRRVVVPGGRLFAQMFSTRHPDFALGIPDADGSCGRFRPGSYFGDIARTFFADGDDIDELYGTRFDIESKELLLVEDHLHDRKIDRSWWTVSARRPA